MLNEVQSFWAKAKIAIVNRQPGTTLEELGRTNIVNFFHILSISEKNERDKK